MKTRLIFLVILWLVFLLLPVEGNAEEDQICLGCHGSKDLSMKFKDGARLSVYVSEVDIKESVHGIVNCTSCHVGLSAEKHPQRSFANRRDYSIIGSQICKKCHTSFKKIHSIMTNEKGFKILCTDCHGAHYIKLAKEYSSDIQYCTGCHSQELRFELRDGDLLSLHIKPELMKESVHYRLSCSDCHYGFSSEEHPLRKFKSKRDYTIASSESCRRCHFDKYTRTLESIHYTMLMHGRTDAPVCVDCHGSHTIYSGRTEKILNAERCKKCHSDIYRVYKESVHGSALISEHNQDVPICSDCHLAHDIVDPRTAAFQLHIPDICGNCHADENLMKKYALSTAVVDTYIQDFHGITLSFYKKQGDAQPIAVCTDCHGIHDIAKTDDPNSLTVKTNLVKRCQKCHQNATENFPDSWISHYEPSLKKAPLVFLINLIYKIFIPFMIIGLVLQILLHVWRYAVSR